MTNIINCKQFYKKGNSYENEGCKFTIIDTRTSKTGRISAKIATTKEGVSDFWTGSVNPEKTEIEFYIWTSSVTRDLSEIKNIKIN